MKRYFLFICLFLLPSCLFADLDSKLLTASSSGKTDDVEAYIFMGADVNIRDEYGKTPLIKAIEHDHIATVKMLLANSADINVKDDNGWTALSVAEYKHNSEIVEILKKSGAKTRSLIVKR